MLKKDKTARNRMSLRTGFIAIAAASLAIPSLAGAQGTDTAFEMTVIRDAAFGAQIAAGEFSSAIERINESSARFSERFFSKNNLCVAYTMSTDFDKAAKECDAAIAIAEEDVRIQKDRDFGVMARYYAMALTNRGVLRAMQGDVGDARKDFEEARLLRVGIAAPTRNLRYLDARETRASID